MITHRCCGGGPVTTRLRRRISRLGASLSASLLPAALWALLPKCPLCLAAWLTAATGLAFPAGLASSISVSLLLVAAATVLAAAATAAWTTLRGK